jgi:hypothetical protein
MGLAIRRGSALFLRRYAIHPDCAGRGCCEAGCPNSDTRRSRLGQSIGRPIRPHWPTVLEVIEAEPPERDLVAVYAIDGARVLHRALFTLRHIRQLAIKTGEMNPRAHARNMILGRRTRILIPRYKLDQTIIWAHHNLQPMMGERALQRFCFIPWRAHPHIPPSVGDTRQEANAEPLGDIEPLAFGLMTAAT